MITIIKLSQKQGCQDQTHMCRYSHISIVYIIGTFCGMYRLQSCSSCGREAWRWKAVYQEAENLYEWRAAFSLWGDKVVRLFVHWWRGWGYKLTPSFWTWHYSHHQLCSGVLFYIAICGFVIKINKYIKY